MAPEEKRGREPEMTKCRIRRKQNIEEETKN
jgi:hypothetical protein